MVSWLALQKIQVSVSAMLRLLLLMKSFINRKALRRQTNILGLCDENQITSENEKSGAWELDNSLANLNEKLAELDPDHT